jgi:hypothetical protein
MTVTARKWKSLVKYSVLKSSVPIHRKHTASQLLGSVGLFCVGK